MKRANSDGLLKLQIDFFLLQSKADGACSGSRAASGTIATSNMVSGLSFVGRVQSCSQIMTRGVRSGDFWSNAQEPDIVRGIKIRANENGKRKVAKAL